MEPFNPLQEDWILEIWDKSMLNIVFILLESVSIDYIASSVRTGQCCPDGKYYIIHAGSHRVNITFTHISTYWDRFRKVEIKELMQGIERIRSGNSTDRIQVL